MSELKHLLDQNKAWATHVLAEDPNFFSRLEQIQSPKYLWIGCSDSRVPANQITGMQPGEVFVHRNIANVVVHTDLNCLSTIQFAVDLLKVEHIIVCGHYGCGGIKATLDGQRVGLADNWLRHVADVMDKHQLDLSNIPQEKRLSTLCELNVIEQALNVCQSTILVDAWQRGQAIQVHAWIYSLHDGKIHALNNGSDSGSRHDVSSIYKKAIVDCIERANA
ncbi:MAG: carbonate dehydratase [Arenimonas sp.]|nr:carbonate dehydratase [Arenimonas sp.]MBP6309085.1 carbonate dehydratase [Arenimonas sp.]